MIIVALKNTIPEWLNPQTVMEMVEIGCFLAAVFPLNSSEMFMARTETSLLKHSEPAVDASWVIERMVGSWERITGRTREDGRKWLVLRDRGEGIKERLPKGHN